MIEKLEFYHSCNATEDKPSHDSCVELAPGRHKLMEKINEIIDVLNKLEDKHKWVKAGTWSDYRYIELILFCEGCGEAKRVHV